MGSKQNLKFDALVLGGGIAGLEAALNLAEQDFSVAVVEKDASIGGKMIRLPKVFPTLDCFAKGIAGIIIMSCGVESPYPGSYEALAKRIDRVYPLMKASGLDIRRLRLTAICTVCTRAFLNEVRQMNELVTELGPPGREQPTAGAT